MMAQEEQKDERPTICVWVLSVLIMLCCILGLMAVATTLVKFIFERISQ